MIWLSENDIPISFSKQTDRTPNSSRSSGPNSHNYSALHYDATKPWKRHKRPNRRHRSLLGHQPHEQGYNYQLGQHRSRHHKERNNLPAQHRQHRHQALNEHNKLVPPERLTTHNTKLGLPEPNHKPQPTTQNNPNTERVPHDSRNNILQLRRHNHGNTKPMTPASAQQGNCANHDV